MTNRGWDIIQSGTCLWSWVLNVPRKTSPHNFMKADDWRKKSRRCAPIAIRYFWCYFDVFRTSNLCSSRTATLWSWCRSCHAQQLFRLGYISLLQLYTELSNCTIVTTTVVILTWCWRSAFAHLQLKCMASNKELTSSKGKVASVPQSDQQAKLVSMCMISLISFVPVRGTALRL